MNAKLIMLAGLPLFFAQASGCAPVALAGEMPLLPQVRAVQYVFDCAAPRALPSQREVGEWTGLHNFAQVYEAREKLMAEVTQACHQPGIAKVQLVQERPLADGDATRQFTYVAMPHR